MFIYLSKKIAIPNNIQLSVISWNKAEGFIACGGDDGLLKVLKLEAPDDQKIKGLAAVSNLSMNQTLEGHSGRIQVITWNQIHQKLTTSDQDGLIIVWMLYKGSWYEEMINNRNKSVVTGMSWNSEGEKICIVYEDGAVIVGSVDGNRIWGKELKGQSFTGVEWSPDGNVLLFSIGTGEVHLYDSQGEFLNKMTITCHGQNFTGYVRIVNLRWYNGRFGYIEPECPSLFVCYEDGKVQIMRSESDDKPVIVDAGMTVSDCQWNHNGTMLAVAGNINAAQSGEKDCNAVMFFSPFGDHARTLKVPGRTLASVGWEGRSLRLSLAVDSFIYFANIRPDYKWCYFLNTVVYTYMSPGKADYNVIFWDVKNNEKYHKPSPIVLAMAASDEHCCILVRKDDQDLKYGMMLCNAIGTPVDSRHTDVELRFVTMTKTHVFAASRESFFVWHYHTPKGISARDMASTQSDDQRSKERVYHVDDMISGVETSRHYERQAARKHTNDPITCLASHETMLLIARESGVVQVYMLPQLIFSNRHTVECRPQKIAVNCDATRISLIDVTGILYFFDLERNDPEKGKRAGELVKFERKDVWDLIWAEDNADMCALMEKTRMLVFRNLDPEEPVASSGYLCRFNDLEVTTVQLDEVLIRPDRPHPKLVAQLESKAMRDTKEILENTGLKEAQEFVEENPHPRLWRLIGEAALEMLETEVAETAFVRCKDYPAIQFAKRLNNISSENIKQAEVLAYFGEFEDSEKAFLDADRRDLAIDLHRKMGNWFRVVQLLKTGVGGDDMLMHIALNKIGDFYADNLKWDQAAKYYEQVNQNEERLSKCYYLMEDYQKLEELVDNIAENHKALPEIAKMFTSVGLCEQAVKAYQKCHKDKEAVEVCMYLNNWRYAVELARTTNIQDTGSYLAKYAQYLLSKNKRIQAIELFRKAGYFLEAAKLLFQLTDMEVKKNSKPMRIKKMYVLAALMVQQHNEKMINTKGKGLGQKSSVMLGLMEAENQTALGDLRVLDNAWKGAEAYHFFLLAQRQLYEGARDAAMKTALHLRDYEAILPLADVYSLLALSSCANSAFSTTSKAFIRLESLPDATAEERQAYEDLAMEIFMKYSPKDSKSNRAECIHCETMIPDWVTICPSCGTRFPSCIASGRPIMDPNQAWECPTCKHQAFESEITVRQTCPLCHAPVYATE